MKSSEADMQEIRGSGSGDEATTPYGLPCPSRGFDLMFKGTNALDPQDEILLWRRQQGEIRLERPHLQQSELPPKWTLP
jgi:hypothetical protein